MSDVNNKSLEQEQVITTLEKPELKESVKEEFLKMAEAALSTDSIAIRAWFATDDPKDMFSTTVPYLQPLVEGDEVGNLKKVQSYTDHMHMIALTSSFTTSACLDYVPYRVIRLKWLKKKMKKLQFHYNQLENGLHQGVIILPGLTAIIEDTNEHLLYIRCAHMAFTRHDPDLAGTIHEQIRSSLLEAEKIQTMQGESSEESIVSTNEDGQESIH